jgi:hypothetical protein
MAGAHAHCYVPRLKIPNFFFATVRIAKNVPTSSPRFTTGLQLGPFLIRMGRGEGEKAAWYFAKI